MKKTKIAIFAIVLVLLLGLTFFQKNQAVKLGAFDPQANDQKILSDSQPETVKYSIEYFRSKEFSPSEFEIVDEVRQTPEFTSYVISYFSGDFKQYALMNVPNEEKEKFPVVIVNHGYINPSVYSTTQSYINTSAYYAANGFLVLKPDYRGHDRSETDDSPNSRLAYTEHVLALIASLENLELADTDNLFMYGHSMGGDITLKILETTDQVKAASLWAPVAQDFPESILYFIKRNRTSEQIQEIENEIFSQYQNEDFQFLNPLNYLQDIKAEIVLHHGTNDQSVPYSWSEKLVNLMKEAGKNVEFYSYEGDDHNISSNFSTALSRDVDFFNNQISH